MRAKIDTHSGNDTGAPFVVDGEGPAFPAWVAAECGSVSGRELTAAEERAHTGLISKAKERELDSLEQF